MKAMILAAGRGNRMRPLTDKTPKPLVKVGQDTLIEHHIKKLAQSGFESIVINLAHLGEQIRNYLGNGSRYDIAIQYSHEGEEALETAGGIAFALPLLGDNPFLVISSDIYSNVPFDPHFQLGLNQMHMIMVCNPEHHPEGDFNANEINLHSASNMRYTYSGIAYLDPTLFNYEKRKFPLLEIIQRCIKENTISSELYQGEWFDVGTASRLHNANKIAMHK